MPLNPLRSRQCTVTCPALAPTCSADLCRPDQTCDIKLRGACACAEAICKDSPTQGTGSSKNGPSTGALAGAVIGILLFLGAVVALALWVRRRQAIKASAATEKKEVPASAADVLNRPDPQEKAEPRAPSSNNIRVYSSSSNTTIDLNPQSQPSIHGTPPYTTPTTVKTNPFDDSHSIQTISTGTSNVIPIALVTPNSDIGNQSMLSQQQQESSRSLSPMRPDRPRDLNLNLEHVNVSGDSLRPYAPSQISGISGVSSRHSYLSSASYSSDFLNEAPMIVTSSRQLLGVSKAEVIQNGGTASTPSTPMTASTLGAPSSARRTLMSPLAATSFGPTDVLSEGDESQEITVNGNPFSDEHSPYGKPASGSPSSVTTFGQPTYDHYDLATASEWGAQGPHHPWAADSRPVSSSTQAASFVANIGSAKRVNLGLQQAQTPTTADSFARSQHRTTIGRLVSPSTPATLQQQQQDALAHAQAQTGAYDPRRTSASSAISTSTRADSILESFHFVPPSPISARPMRSPPLSPLAQKAFTVSEYPPQQQHLQEQSSPLDPPNRRMLGMSTGSQLSTASNGLGSFPFQIEPECIEQPHQQPPPNPAPSSYSNANNARQRASLDTLALTSDLSSYPLGFDRR